MRLEASLEQYVQQRLLEFDQIPAERRAQLAPLARYVQECVDRDQPVRLTFVCTHNSRRSHLSQLWAQVAAARVGVREFEAYSGGTEATAFNPRAVEAARRAGFLIERTTRDENPIYHVRYSQQAPPLTCFSKTYAGSPNPRKNFCAVMVCSEADGACPSVPGASERIAIPFEDPKAFDNTPQEASKYDERCRQIARELLFVFSQVKPRSRAQ